MKKRKLLIPLIVSILGLAGCGKKNVTPSEDTSESESESEVSREDTLEKPVVDSFNRTYTKLDSNSVYVNKVENLASEEHNFILGMDASSVIAEEDSGVKYYDFEGNEADVFEVLSYAGVNYIRVRIWNDPYDEDGHGYGGGNNDLAKAIEIGKRATAHQMSLLVDFHYSDFWADPSKQMSPKAWSNFNSVDETATALYEFTKDCLQQLVDNNIVVGMVQVGNENNAGNIAGWRGFNNYVKLAGAGSKAVREICPDALVAVHFANPEKTENYLNYANRIKNLDYDVFGSSYYPYWHGTIANLSNILSQIANEYNKYVMVMETSYAYTPEDSDYWTNTIGATSGYDNKFYPFTMHGQVNEVVDLIDEIVNNTANGIGVCYWEGTWISVGGSSWEENSAKWEQYGSGWASSYSVDYDPNDAGKWYGGCAVENQAFFDETGHPLESLKLFNLCRYGNEIEKFVDGVNDVELIHYDNDVFTLPETVEAVYCDNSKVNIPVVWEDFDIEAAKKAGNARYTIHGLAEGYDVYCKLTIMEYNYVQNYSFEEGDKYWTRTTNDNLGDTHKIQVTNENPQTGKYAYHFWTTDPEGVNFELTQEFKDLKAGNYKLQCSMLGGGNGTDAITPSKQTVYIYIAINGTIVKQESHTITKWADGYSDVKLTGVSYTSGTLTVGIHVEISEANCWGDIDDVMLNYAG